MGTFGGFLFCFVFFFNFYIFYPFLFNSYFWCFTGNSTERRMFYYKIQLQLPVGFVENCSPFTMRQDSSPSPPQSKRAGQQNQKINKKQRFKNLQIFQVHVQADTTKSPQVIKWETKMVSELTTRISSVMRHHIFHFFICLVPICKDLRAETPFRELKM